MLPASSAPQFAFLGSLVAHAAVATALAGVGYARSSEQPPAHALITFETVEAPPEPAELVEPPPVVLPPQPPKPRPHAQPRARLEPSNPKAEPVSAAAAPPAEPAPSELPITPVATVDANTLATSSISVPAAAAQRIAGPGVIAARASTSTQSAGKSLTAEVDRSRRASLADGARWDCPFPNEAESEGIESAKAVLRVELDAQGQPLKVIVTEDPGYGFGREARRCAMRRRWMSRLDRSGAPTSDAVTVVVNFERS